MRDRARLAALLAAALVVGGCGTAQRTGSQPGPTSPSVSVTSVPRVSFEQVEDAGARLDDAGRAHRIDGFAEVRVDEAALAVDVFVTDASATNVARIRDLAGPLAGRVRVHPVPFSADHLDALMQRVVSREPELERRGVAVNTVSKDVERGTVVVGVGDPGAARAVVKQMLGDEVTVERADPGEAGSG